MSVPVTISTNGRGLAVTSTSMGAPVAIAASLGYPVIFVASGGIPVTIAGNVLRSLSWSLGADTAGSVVGQRSRATATNFAVNLPKTYKSVSGLTNGATYRINGTVYKGTAATNVIFRVSTSADLSTGNLFTETVTAASKTYVNQTFVMSGTTLTIGIVGTVTANGQYVEIDTGLSLTRV